MKKQSLRLFRWTGWIPVCLVAVIALTVVACSDDDNDPTVPSPFTTDLTFGAGEVDTTIVFNAYSGWKASVTKSDVVEIVSAKTGNAGEIKMEIHISKNATFVPRGAEIHINDGRSSVNMYRIVQNPASRAINFSKALNFVQTDTLFTDTVTVVSNVAWEVGEKPEWVKSWKKVNPDLMPEDGVNTEIAVVFIADNSKFTTTKMTDEINFQDVNQNKYPLPVEFAGFTPSITFDTTVLVLEQNEGSEVFNGRLVVTSNVNWTVDKTEAPFIGEISEITDPIGNALQSENVIWISVDPEKLTTDEQTGVLHFKDEATNLDVPMNVKFVGTGNDYINFEREKIFDKAFDAKGMDDNTGEPIPGALTSVDFNVFAAEPVDFIIIKYDNGFPWHQEVWWAGVDEVSPINRSAIKSGTYTLWVQDRYQGFEADKERMAMLFVVPKGITIDDLFDGDSDDLKPEWEGKGTHFKQKGLVIDYYMTLGDISDGSTVVVAKEGGEKPLNMETDSETWSVYYDGLYAAESNVDWVSVEGNSENGWNLVVKPNNTGKSRRTEVSFRAWRGDGVEEQVLITFWVSQDK